jgi:hypothetical protein
MAKPKKPFQVTMRVVAHVFVRVEEAHAALAEEKASKWLEEHLPRILEHAAPEVALTITDVENVDARLDVRARLRPRA